MNKKRFIKYLTVLFVAVTTVSSASCGLVQRHPDGVGRNSGSADYPSSSEVTSGAPVNADPDEVRVKLAAAGDNLIHESVYRDAAVRAAAMASDGGYTGDYYFYEMYSERLRNVISSADVAFVNQESPIVPERPASGYPAFNTPKDAGDTLVDMGFDVVNMANNHMLDMEGICEGLRSTINYWKSKDVLPIGAYESDEDYNTIRVMESKGRRIAFLSYTYGTNGNKLNPASSDLVIPYIDDSVIIEQVSRARDIADAVIVSMHWGNENEFTPTEEQKRLAGLLSKYGANVVIGHHSHTLQPVEWVENEAGGRTLVIYSLGNLISSQMKAYNMVGGIATFDLVFDPDGKVSVENPVLMPTMTHYIADAKNLDSQGLPTRSEVSVMLFEEYTSDMCASHGAQLPELNGPFTLDTLRGYIKGAIDEEFLPDFIK